MNDDVASRIKEYMSRCSVCAIATASLESEPSVATVYFENVGMNIYFNTGTESRKARNIAVNPGVAIVMQDAPRPASDREITGVQYFGRAEVLSDAQLGEVPKAVATRHRAFNNSSPGTSAVVKVSPSRIYLIDYSLGFRHRDLLQF